MAMPGVLIVTDVAFWRDDQGSRSRIAAMCRHLLSTGFRLSICYAHPLSDEERLLLDAFSPPVTVYAPENPPQSASRPDKPAAGLRERLKSAIPSGLVTFVQRMEWAAGWVYAMPRRAFQRALRQLRPETVTLNEERSESFRTFVHERCRELRPNAVIVEYVRLAYVIDGLESVVDAMPLRVIDTLDVMHVRAERYRLHGETHRLRISREEEARALAAFDVVVAIQQQDARVLQAMVPDTPVITVGHVVPVKHHTPNTRAYTNLLYVATDARFNVRSIRHFLKRVWPTLRKRFGDSVQLTLVGTICSALNERVRRPGITFQGYVNCLDDVYEDAAIVINPVLFGGGLKIKCVEGLCHGKPVVTTPVGAEGLEDALGNGLFSCETPERMIEVLNGLVEDKKVCREAGERAAQFAAAHFTEGSVYRPLDEQLLRSAEERV